MTQPTMDELRELRDRLAPRATPSNPDGLSRDQRRTKRNAELLGRAVHPATRRPLLAAEPVRTCRECAHHQVQSWGGSRTRYFHKCELHRLGMSHGPDSDIRISWPACELFEAAS